MDTRTEVEQYFKGAQYPATKHELIILAREKTTLLRISSEPC